MGNYTQLTPKTHIDSHAMMTSTQVVVTSVTVNNSPIQLHIHADNHISPTHDMTPGFKPFTQLLYF